MKTAAALRSQQSFFSTLPNVPTTQVILSNDKLRLEGEKKIFYETEAFFINGKPIQNNRRSILLISGEVVDSSTSQT